jgi:hypothetical protein
MGIHSKDLLPETYAPQQMLLQFICINGRTHRMKTMTFLAALVLLGACGKSSQPPGSATGSLRLGNAEYVLIEPGTLAPPAGIGGTGALVFNTPLAEKDNNFTLRFRLQPKGSVTLVTNTTSKLEHGVALSFSREENDAVKALLTAGTYQYDMSKELSLNGAGELALEIDVHDHGHVIIWQNGGKPEDFTFAMPRSGRFWGVRLDKAFLSTAGVAKAKSKR